MAVSEPVCGTGHSRRPSRIEGMIHASAGGKRVWDSSLVQLKTTVQSGECRQGFYESKQA
jgi:hypothetical protein